MPLLFHRVYRLDCLTPAYLDSPQIAIGVRKAPLVMDGKPKHVIQFLTPNDSNFAHYIDGEIESEGDEGIVVNDVGRSKDYSEPVRWKFVPLTLENWGEIEIAGADRVRRYVGTDADLQRFYQDQWMPDWWEEHPGAETPVPTEQEAQAEETPEEPPEAS